ncbi:MAG: hypothetical protein M3Q73_02685, partial [bacterium]|nr:hypothetical protein [bacterium]
ACKDTHVLMVVFTMSIIEIRDRFVNHQPRLFHKQDWYNIDAFAKDKGEIGWRLVAKTPVENSIGKKWDKQQKLLGKNDETPSARIMVYTMVGHFLATGERLFTDIYVRCSDHLSVMSGGNRVVVGVFDSDGLIVNFSWGDDRDSNIGLSSARK